MVFVCLPEGRLPQNQVTVAYVESRLFMAEASSDPNVTNDWDVWFYRDDLLG